MSRFEFANSEAINSILYFFSISFASAVLKYGFLIIASIVSVFPLYYMVVCSTNSSVDILSTRMIPGAYLLKNLKSLLENTDFLICLKNSVRYAVVGTILSVIVCSLAGYAFEIYHDKAKDLVMSILLLSIMVPVAATLIPLFTLFGKMNLLSTTLGVTLPFISTAFLILLFRQNSRAFPTELIDSARIDGLNEFQIFIQMYVPIMKPVFATATIVSFMHIWNDYLWSLVAMRTAESRSLALLLSAMSEAYTLDYGLLMLLATLTTLPLAVIFFFLQKYFTAGITGSVKG